MYAIYLAQGLQKDAHPSQSAEQWHIHIGVHVACEGTFREHL